MALLSLTKGVSTSPALGEMALLSLTKGVSTSPALGEMALLSLAKGVSTSPTPRGANGVRVFTSPYGDVQPGPTGCNWHAYLCIGFRMVPDLISPTLQDLNILVHVDFKRKLF
jgi:hypothetical protein